MSGNHQGPAHETRDDRAFKRDFNERCTRCMSCESACPLTPLGGGVGPLIRRLDREGPDAAEGDPAAWQCAMCMKCEAVCPQGLEPRRWLTALRRTGPVPAVYAEALRRVAAEGFVFPNPQPVEEMEAVFPWTEWLCSADA